LPIDGFSKEYLLLNFFFSFASAFWGIKGEELVSKKVDGETTSESEGEEDIEEDEREV
jgi:hypothetical protein